LAEARLEKDVAFLGKMSPYAVLKVQEQTWKSQIASNAGQLPVWNDAHLIEADSNQLIEIIVYHKTMIFADVEIGRVSLGQDRLPVKNEWIELYKEGALVGKLRTTIVVSEELTADYSHFSTRHSSHNSADLKDDIAKKLLELEQERRELKAAKMRYQEKLTKLELFNKADTTEIRDLKASLDNEKGLVGFQETKIREAMVKLKAKSEKLANERRKLRSFRDELKCKEEAFLKRREDIEKRRKRLSVRRQEIEMSQVEVIEEFKKLQKDRQKMNVQNKISAISKRQTTQDKRAMMRRKQAYKAVEHHFSPQVGRTDSSDQWKRCSTECEKENLLDSCVKPYIPRSTGKAPLSPLAVQMIQQVRSGRLICF